MYIVIVKVPSMIGIEIMPHVLPSVYMVMLLTLSKLIKTFIELVPLIVNYPDHLPHFLRSDVLLIYSKKVRGL